MTPTLKCERPPRLHIGVRRAGVAFLVSLVLLFLLDVARVATGPSRVEAAWLAGYPGLCSKHSVSVSLMPSMSPWSYQLKCEIHPPTMDYANPVVIVDTWNCTAVTYLPNLSLPAVYLGTFSSPQRMPVCP
jgi:hypothetical protein